VRLLANKNSPNSTVYYTHGFHPYPAKYTPQMVQEHLYKNCKKGDVLLDPFCGSGTTIVEGVINGIHSVGIDLNPIACIITKAKTNRYKITDIRQIYNFIDRVKTSNQTLTESVIIHDFPNKSHWFQDNVCLELSKLKLLISSIEESSIKDLLHCAFSKIIVKVSNQDSEVRYVAVNKNIPDGYVINLFIETLYTYISSLDPVKYADIADATIIKGDTLTALRQFEDDYFDFVMTSPPYINTFDYYLYHKLRMFWLDYDFKPVRKQEIGNHHRIDRKDFTTAKREYEDIMMKIFVELSRVTKKYSSLVLVIGDGIVDKHTINMVGVITEICKHTSYRIKSIESRDLADITRSFNKKFTNSPKKEHTIIMHNDK